MRRLLSITIAGCALFIASASTAALSFAQPMPGGWQPGPGAAGDNTYTGTIDSPANGANLATQGPVNLSGWFVDTTAQGWAGADDMQVFVGSMDSGTLLAHGRVGLN